MTPSRLLPSSLLFATVTLSLTVACGGGSDDSASSSSAGGSGGATAGNGSAGASAGTGGATAGSGTAGSGTAGGAQGGGAGKGTAGTGTAGTGTAGSGTAGTGTAGSGTAGGTPSDKTRSLALSASKMGTGGADLDWFAVGENVDGKQFATPSTPGHCKLAPGASMKQQVDGPAGQDNAFARDVLPVLQTLAADAGNLGQEAAAGHWTFLIRFPKATFGANEAQLDADFLRARGSGSPPPASWASYFWMPPSNAVTNPTGQGDTLVAKNKLTGSVTGDTWTGTSPLLEIVLPVTDYAFPLRIRNAKLVVPLSADHTTATTARLSGVLVASEVRDSMAVFAGTVSSSLCGGAALDGVLSQITAAADMGADGTQDPSKTCDGISFGMQLDMKVSQIAGTGATDEVKNPCP